jgi:uncharacterized Fe-S center protein
MVIHYDGKPKVNQSVCTCCKICTRFCANDAISFDSGKAFINETKCVGCGRCIGACGTNAIESGWDASRTTMCCKIAEYTKAVLDGRPNFHISVVNQVSPYCDCHDESDAAIIPDIGIFAGFDPVALDKACIDAVNAAPVIQSSILGKCERGRHDANGNEDHFTNIHPTTDWRDQISHAEKIGLGSGKYELITVK